MSAVPVVRLHPALGADSTPEAAARLELSLTNDTSLGVIRYADAGYAEALDEAAARGIGHIRLAGRS